MFIGYKNIYRRRRANAIKSHSVQSQLIKLGLVLIILLVTHTSCMVYFEKLTLGDAVWLTLTSATTVGYGDLTAHTTIGRIATILLLYVGGIAILAQVAAMFFEHRQEIRIRMLTGDWSWPMEDHIVFMNCPDELDEEYFYQAFSGLRNSGAELADLPILILCEHFKSGISDRLRHLDVVHISRSVFDHEALEAAYVLQAHTIVLLARSLTEDISDSVNFDLVDRLRGLGVTSRIVVEVVKDENRPRMKKIGANNVLRPIRTYPELLMRSILAPGSEQVIETLFDSYGEECIRYEVNVSKKWIDIIHILASNDLGIPIAYESDTGEIVNNPSAHSEITAKGIFVIVKEGGIKTNEEINELLEMI